MKLEEELHIIRDEVFRKIGRNLLNFQKVELMLKHLIAKGRLSGYKSELKQTQEAKVAAVRKKTMGTLIGEFFENTFQIPNESSSPVTERKEPYLSITFCVKADAEFYESKRQALKLLVDDRNDLIHHLLPRFDSDSIESCLEINDYLDRQRERLIPEYDYLKSLIETQMEIADFLSSEQGGKEFKLITLQQSSIVRLLLDISVQKPRKDGWTYLSAAVQQIHQILPGEIANLEARRGYEKLTDLMRASNYFDVLEEGLSNGCHRFIYRSKPELAYPEQDRVLQFLFNLSEQTENADGWSSLTIAEQRVNEVLADDIAQIKAALNCRSLIEIMIEWECFEFQQQGDSSHATIFFKPNNL